MDFQVGDETPLTPDIDAHATALTQLESSAQEIHKSLNAILDYQTHHRLVSFCNHFFFFNYYKYEKQTSKYSIIIMFLFFFFCRFSNFSVKLKVVNEPKS